MKLLLEQGKFSIEPTLTFDELSKLDNLIAHLAQHDVGKDVGQMIFRIVDGGLYGNVERQLKAPGGRPHNKNVRYYFDPSIRRWSECEH